MTSYSSTAVSRAPRERSIAAPEGTASDAPAKNPAPVTVPGAPVGSPQGRGFVVNGDVSVPTAIAPIDSISFKQQAYAALRNVIVSLDVYRSRADIRLDERKLAQDFGISRTPVREALAQLEREGFVRSVPRRGIYVVRKTRAEVIELITAWAALEGMAARLITQHARDEEIAGLRRMFATFERGQVAAKLDEYSEVNIEFHQAIIRMSGNGVLVSLAENLFTHMRMIRRKTIAEQDRADRSIRDHMNIIEALEARATDRAEELVRNHALGLAEHVAKYADYLD
jgi:DNA-binding GntR family transcriptional regulator